MIGPARRFAIVLVSASAAEALVVLSALLDYRDSWGVGGGIFVGVFALLLLTPTMFVLARMFRPPVDEDAVLDSRLPLIAGVLIGIGAACWSFTIGPHVGATVILVGLVPQTVLHSLAARRLRVTAVRNGDGGQ